MCLQHEIGAQPRHQFERLIAAGSCDWKRPNRSQRRLGRGDRAERHAGLARPRHQFQHRGGDDAERAFGADEQLAQAIAGVVLAQPAQPVPHRAIRQHHLQPEHQVARIAVAHGVVAAGVGGEHAADLRAALRGDRQRQQAPCLGRRVLRRLQRHAGFDGHGQVERIDVADARHPGEAQHEFAAVLGRRGAADHRGVATLRHDRRPRRGAQPDHARQFVGAGGADHRRRAAAIEAPPVLGIAGGIGGIGQQAVVADHRADGVEQGCVGRNGLCPARRSSRVSVVRPRAAMLQRWTSLSGRPRRGATLRQRDAHDGCGRDQALCGGL